MQQFL